MVAVSLYIVVIRVYSPPLPARPTEQPPGRGVLVTNISRGFAMNAGLRPGDLVRRVNGREIGSVRELTGVLGGGGGQWQVTIERNGQEITANFRT